MRKFFFEKGKEVQIGGLAFILADNKIDAQCYILDRVVNPSPSYVYDRYSSLDHTNMIRYMTCWQEIEQVQVKKQKKQEIKKQQKIPKKTSLSSFLSKKKTVQHENSLHKNQMVHAPINKAQKQIIKTEIEDHRVLYVQLQTFSAIDVPLEITKIKQLFALVYLMAKSVQEETGAWPFMIPVLDNQQKLKFIRKGQNEMTEVIRLFEYLTEFKAKAEWSENIKQFYKKVQSPEMQKSTEFKKGLFKLIISEIKEQILEKEYQIVMKKDGVSQTDFCKIVGPDTLEIKGLDESIYLPEYDVIPLCTKSQKNRNFMLQHTLYDPIHISLPKKTCRFLIKFLDSFTTIQSRYTAQSQ